MSHYYNKEELVELKRKYDMQVEKEALEEINTLRNIIKEVREYIENKYDYVLGDEDFLDHDELIDRKQIKHILEILDKEKV